MRLALFQVRRWSRAVTASWGLRHPQCLDRGYDVVVNRPSRQPIGPGTPAAALRWKRRSISCAKSSRWTARVPPTQQRQRGYAPGDWSGLPARRLCGDAPGGQGSPPLQRTAHRPVPGRGVASGFWGNGTGPSSALAIVNPDGSVQLVEGSPDIGGTRASVSQQLAEVLGIPIEDVNPSVGGHGFRRLHLQHRRQRRDVSKTGVGVL